MLGHECRKVASAEFRGILPGAVLFAWHFAIILRENTGGRHEKMGRRCEILFLASLFFGYLSKVSEKSGKDLIESTSRAGQAGGGSFQKEKNYKAKNNLPIECHEK